MIRSDQLNSDYYPSVNGATCTMTSSNWPMKLFNFRLISRAMLLINLIFEFCVVIVQAGCTPRAWLPSDLATSPLVCNLYIIYLCNPSTLYAMHVLYNDQA